jgi:hypothetical protein
MADELWQHTGKDLERSGGQLDRPSRWTPKRVASLALVAVVLLLVVTNTGSTSVHLLLFSLTFPLWMLLGGIMVVSFLAGWLFGGHRARRD